MKNRIGIPKEDLTRRILEDLRDAHELDTRINYERWNKKIEHDTKIASQCLEVQAVEICRRVGAMASSTFELLQRNMEATGPAVGWPLRFGPSGAICALSRRCSSYSTEPGHLGE